VVETTLASAPKIQSALCAQAITKGASTTAQPKPVSRDWDHATRVFDKPTNGVCDYLLVCWANQSVPFVCL
jgi:hypothetical protein